MWTTFLVQIRTLARQRGTIFWVMVFPILLATLFYGMFSSLDKAYVTETQSVAVVQDSAWKANEQADALVDALARGGKNTALIARHDVESAAQAIDLVNSGKAIGYLRIDGAGEFSLAISDNAASTSDYARELTISVLNNAIARANESRSLHSSIGESRPQAFADPKVIASIASNDAFTRETTLTHTKPDPAARYYYALLGMACLMSMSLAITSIASSQANLSPLGARRALAPLPKHGLVLSAFLAAWLMAFACMSIAFFVIRVPFGVRVGGREAAAFAGLAVATFMSSALGSVFGAIPRIPLGQKLSICSAFSCIAALFAGLYGEPAMKLGDFVQREAPVLSDLNPARQVSLLFYDILYYDSYAPFLRTVGMLAAMGLFFLAIAIILLRRQRYEYL
ncbi:ABC transporter permease [Bifidobacterium tibiigranuli]|jgi:ABC-type multidrug transport system permease subunit|uniref:ABC transporter permease n=1 Tax=Bifidobacterium tibiigranuli TaxID=2172043 RepID=UPI0026F0523F|nr:ABC transporter permease [Bifidobacterium tibiigranuli]MCI1649138.1 ABC transporter permease [Bifidobacterium tibiigranuli]MCI2185556.1 ABC transporter permease [Bifidobacterium tibiigranuli]MCI2203469.1 ABC transporter permease [Bifidobacterium tibiigranuli]